MSHANCRDHNGLRINLRRYVVEEKVGVLFLLLNLQMIGLFNKLGHLALPILVNHITHQHLLLRFVIRHLRT